MHQPTKSQLLVWLYTEFEKTLMEYSPIQKQRYEIKHMRKEKRKMVIVSACTCNQRSPVWIPDTVWNKGRVCNSCVGLHNKKSEGTECSPCVIISDTKFQWWSNIPMKFIHTYFPWIHCNLHYSGTGISQ